MRAPATRTRRELSPTLPDGLPAGLTTEVSEQAWGAAQNRLAQLLPRTRHQIAGRSQHYIMFSQPALIIRALRGVVTAVRKRSAG